MRQIDKTIFVAISKILDKTDEFCSTPMVNALLKFNSNFFSLPTGWNEIFNIVFSVIFLDIFEFSLGQIKLFNA